MRSTTIRDPAGLERLAEGRLQLGRGEQVDLAARRRRPGARRRSASLVRVNSGGIGLPRLTDLRRSVGSRLSRGSSSAGSARRRRCWPSCRPGRRRRRGRRRCRPRAGRRRRAARWAPVGAQIGPTRSSRRSSSAATTTCTWPSRGVAGRVGGDRVGEQDRVVEAVDRALGARGEHPDDAAEHGADAAGRCGRGRRASLTVALAAHANAPRRDGASRSKVMRTSVSSRSSGAELERLGQRGDQRQAEAEPRAVGARQDATARGR